MPLLFELEFGSYLSYTKLGKSKEAERSQTIMNTVKTFSKLENPSILATTKIVHDLRDDYRNQPFKDFFGPDTLLVAIPGHAISSDKTRWLTYEVVKEMESNGLGIASNCLKRTKWIRKSSSCKNSEDRPKPKEHLETLHCASILHAPKQIVLIDDVLTSGSTALACASVLQEAFPNARIIAFALIRYENDWSKFKGIKDPIIGQIKLRSNGLTTRTP